MESPYRVVADFEQAIAEFTGAPYAVAVDSCSSALFLCCQAKHNEIANEEIRLPKHTYPSAANAIVHAGGKIKFIDLDWQKIRGYYELGNTLVYDCAKYICRGMFETGYMCLSFHSKKCLPIGRGGMILMACQCDYEWFKYMRYDGRHEKPLPEDKLAGVGYHMIMLPEEAARGLELMQWLPDENIGGPDYYPDLSQYKFYTEANRGICCQK